MGGTNDLSPSSTVSTTTSSTQASFCLSCRRLYEALEEKAIDLQVPYILSSISNRIYGRRQSHCPRKEQCHPFHIFFMLYSVPIQCAGLPESIRHGRMTSITIFRVTLYHTDIKAFHTEAKSLFADPVWVAARALKNPKGPDDLRNANLQLAAAEILS